METTITVDELAKHLPEVLDRVRDQRDQFVIERDGQRIATLTPIESARPFTLHDLVRLRMQYPPDDRFADDLEEIRRSQPPQEMPDWPD